MVFDNYKFHCSSLGLLMTGSRTKDPLGETTKTHLLECWIAAKYGRTKESKELTNKYIEKGNSVEESSITLYSRVKKKFYKKNQQTFENEFICGTPDIIDGKSVIDIKSSWSMHTFFANFHKPLNKDYLWQINGYMDLIPCDAGKLVYVLVNTPETILEQEKSKLRYKMGLIDPEADGLYMMAAKEIEHNGTFDDVPIAERWVEFTVPTMEMEQAYTRVKECRNFMNALG